MVVRLWVKVGVPNRDALKKSIKCGDEEKVPSYAANMAKQITVGTELSSADATASGVKAALKAGA